LKHRVTSPARVLAVRVIGDASAGWVGVVHLRRLERTARVSQRHATPLGVVPLCCRALAANAPDRSGVGQGGRIRGRHARACGVRGRQRALPGVGAAGRVRPEPALHGAWTALETLCVWAPSHAHSRRMQYGWVDAAAESVGRSGWICAVSFYLLRRATRAPSRATRAVASCAAGLL